MWNRSPCSGKGLCQNGKTRRIDQEESGLFEKV